ncbi:MAG: sigma 54-interacting transcriptional regulator, partial [Terriglobales bacterium]
MSSLLVSPQSPVATAPAAVLGTNETLGLLIVSSNEELRQELAARLQSDQWTLQEVASGAEALEKIDAGEVSMVLMDPNLPDLKVDEFRAIVQAQYPYVTVIPVNPHTGQPIVATPSPDSICFEIVRKIERGAPFRRGNAVSTCATADADSLPASLPGFIGMAPPVQRLCSVVRLVAPRDTTVLITGESGTGKDVVARAVHQLSPRRLKPFVVINCAAIPEALLEAELFGFVKGAFTGAVQS